MISIPDIINYVRHTPENTNINVLEPMLYELVERYEPEIIPFKIKLPGDEEFTEFTAVDGTMLSEWFASEGAQAGISFDMSNDTVFGTEYVYLRLYDGDKNQYSLNDGNILINENDEFIPELIIPPN